MKDTSCATVMTPLATRKPPTPRTTKNETCMAMEEMGTTKAEMRATLSPAFQASRASASTVSISRLTAFAARTVRTAEMLRSTAAVRSPTRSCATREYLRMRLDRTMTMIMEATTTLDVNPKRIASMKSMAMMAPTKVTEPPMASTNPCVRTARNIVESAPTRETRSPVRRASNSLMGRLRSRETRCRRDDRTTDSPVRCNK